VKHERGVVIFHTPHREPPQNTFFNGFVFFLIMRLLCGIGAKSHG